MCMSQLKPKPERVYKVKMRPCLKCRKPFESSWAGERICQPCKSSQIWRGGTNFELRALGKIANR